MPSSACARSDFALHSTNTRSPAKICVGTQPGARTQARAGRARIGRHGRAVARADLHLLPRARGGPRRPAAEDRRARRAAVHRHPPGLRAVVQAAAARARPPAAPARGGGGAARARHGAARPDDPEDGRRADRRARDDDAEPVRELPHAPRLRQRLSVRPVPRARGGARPARRRRAARLRGRQPRPRAHRRRDGPALALRLVRALPRDAGTRRAGVGARPRRHAAARGERRRAARDPRRLPARRRGGAGRGTARRPRRGRAGVALPPRQDGRAHDRRQGRDRRLVRRRVPAHDAVPADVPRPVGGPLGAVSALGPEDLRASPSPLAGDYARFRVGERLLLSGHSHQAWPDVALEGVVECFEDAASRVDDKWGRAFAKAHTVRAAIGALLGDPAADVALGQNTHELVVRFLSALDLRARPRLVTTDGEFHTLRRQLARLGEAGLDVVRLEASHADTLAERLSLAVDDRTACVLVSAVLFETARIVPGLDALARACAAPGAELLVDVYHALGPRRLSLPELGLEDAWVT